MPPSEVDNRRVDKGSQCYCIGQILGFIEYATPGYPTFFLAKHRQMSKNHIRRSLLRDERTHVVVDCSIDHFNKEELDINFITPFQLKLNDSGLKILPIEVITQPLAVVTNYKAVDQTHYLACLPKSKWHRFFQS